jgi:pyruvate,water dikinase
MFSWHLGKKTELGCPQDIEWAIAGGKVFLLQSRPITTLEEKDPVMGNWNNSKKWNFLWSSVNAGEALPEVMTPSTWVLWRTFHNETLPFRIPGGYPYAGIIGGRYYFNFSLLYSIYRLLMKPEDALHRTEELLGKIPGEISIPEIYFSKLSLAKMFFENLKWEYKYVRLKRQIPEYIDTTPDWCKGIRNIIDKIKSKNELINLWQEDIKPYLFHSFWMLRAAMKLYSEPAEKLRKELKGMVGEEDASALLSNISEEKELASLGLVLGLSKVVKGKMTREEFIEKYGHRSPNEMELSEPRPYEKKEWLDKRLREFKNNSIDVQKLLEKQHSEHKAALERACKRYPKKENSLKRRIRTVSKYGHKREGVRSEVTRVISVVRHFYLKAGILTGIGDDIFFLSYDEVLQVLNNNEEPLKYILKRRKKYEEFKSLPDYPTFINGRFDPFIWAANPERCCDFYNENSEESRRETSDYIKGFPGASGKVEGIVRVIKTPDEGGSLKKGEILVTAKTNVGWTPFFPVAAAIITDVGAPLSHAAIVARELGIPAVVGCGNATERLRTGDRVIVDGGKGLVKIIQKKE